MSTSLSGSIEPRLGPSISKPSVIRDDCTPTFAAVRRCHGGIGGSLRFVERDEVDAGEGDSHRLINEPLSWRCSYRTVVGVPRTVRIGVRSRGAILRRLLAATGASTER